MFCPGCGAQVPDGSAVCTGCGAVLKPRVRKVSPKSVAGIALACVTFFAWA